MTDAELDAYVKTAEDEQASSGAVLALVSALREARRVLREIQWNGEGGHWEEAACPECGQGRPSAHGPPARYEGHLPGCALAEAIR